MWTGRQHPLNNSAMAKAVTCQSDDLMFGQSTTPSLISCLISLSEYPASSKTSNVCSPIFGCGLGVQFPGVLDSFGAGVGS